MSVKEEAQTENKLVQVRDQETSTEKGPEQDTTPATIDLGSPTTTPKKGGKEKKKNYSTTSNRKKNPKNPIILKYREQWQKLIPSIT